MLFPTLDFAGFFALVFVGAWLLNPWPRRWRCFLLVASYVFYGWADWHLTLLLGASTAVSWVGGLAINRQSTRHSRTAVLWVCVVTHLAILGWFKYYGFAALNLANALRSLGLPSALPLLQIALPVGLSFFTFMGLSYLIDIWRGKLVPAPALDVAVYLSFFPHLVAGPIVRADELLPQIRRSRDGHRVDGARGVWLILRGLTKKILLSSYLAAAIVDPVFGAPRAHSGLEVLFALYAYAVQIYADFSGYTDIAIGVALLLGVRFPENFDRPYTATSLQDFWRRWHITLSRWLRDYLYIPLGGSQGGRRQTARNIMLTMLLGGLWHGAGWTFLAWGAFHGVGQAIGHLRRERKPLAGNVTAAGPSQWQRAAQQVVTFHVVCLGWLLFRADTLATAATMLARLFDGRGPSPLVTPALVAVVAGALAVQHLPAGLAQRALAWFSELGAVPQGAFLGAGLFAVTSLGPPGVAPFIYYRF